MSSNRLYAVGGIDSRLTVSTAEYLDIGSGISKSAIQQTDVKRNNNKNTKLPLVDESSPISEWKELTTMENLADMLHGGGTSIVSIGTTLYALSIYGTSENDKTYDTTQPDARYVMLEVLQFNIFNITLYQPLNSILILQLRCINGMFISGG